MIETLVDFINASNKETLADYPRDTSNYEDEDITTLETLKDVDKEDLQLFFQKRVDIGFLILILKLRKIYLDRETSTLLF